MRASNGQRLPRPFAPRRWLPLALGLGFLGGHDGRAEVPPAPDPATVAAGRELFHREWLPMDPRSHGGDGLGPAYNDSSCVACHSLGGPGGAGPASKNVDLLSLEIRSPTLSNFAETRQRRLSRAQTVMGRPLGVTRVVDSSLVGDSRRARILTDPEPTLLARLADFRGRVEQSALALCEVFRIHPGFREARTLTAHRFGTDAAYARWRRDLFPDGESSPRIGGLPVIASPRLGGDLSDDDFGPVAIEPALRRQIARDVESFDASLSFSGAAVVRSQRNTTPLFGLGLIDAIPDAVIEAEAARQADQTSPTAGRVSRVRDGKIGRLGWKGQTAHLADFVLDACATEVGLEVPGRSQGALPNVPAKAATGLDLTADECNALTTFVASLPRPQQRPSGGAEAEAIAAGRARFAAVGCADCHVPDLGPVAGLYSDLLLHDMGSLTASAGSYGGSSGEGDSDEAINPALAAQRLGPVERGPAPRSTPGASKGEWRTPPLWGVRDSAPYLHDGRARTLEQAIALHGGQADASARRYFSLPAEDRVRVEAFLRSLVAPAVREPVAMR